MALQFYPLIVKKIKRETTEAVSVSFEIPEHLKDIFKYQHGQYLTLKINVNKENNRRAYSISSSPLWDEPLTVTVKRAENGIVSNYINHFLKEGDVIDAFPPLGHFTFQLEPDKEKLYVLFGGGSGITPLVSIIKTVLKGEPKSNIILFYVNRNEESIIFKNFLTELESASNDKLKIYHALTQPSELWSGLRGRLNKSKVKELINQYVSANYKGAEYYLCGPVGLMAEIRDALLELQVPEKQIHKESFTAPLPDELETTPAGTAKKETEMPEFRERKIKVKIYGEEHEITVAPDETVLTAAMGNGLDPPFSCQIGACSTCRAKLHSGRVVMDEREALTDEEMEEGYILTCQSHPMTDDVVVDYDE